MLYIESKDDRYWEHVNEEDRSDKLFMAVIDRSTCLADQLTIAYSFPNSYFEEKTSKFSFSS